MLPLPWPISVSLKEACCGPVGLEAATDWTAPGMFDEASIFQALWWRGSNEERACRREGWGQWLMITVSHKLFLY